MSLRMKAVTMSVAVPIAVLFSGIGGVEAASPNDHLVAHWTFDVPGDSSPNDEAPAGVAADDANFSGDAGYSDGSDLPPVSGNISALELDGLGDFAWAPDSNDLDMGGSYSIAAWVRPDLSGSEMNVVSKDLGVTQGNYIFHVWKGRVFFGHTFNVIGRVPCSATADSYLCQCDIGSEPMCYVIGGSIIPIGEWRHITGVYDDGTKSITVYIDGVEDGAAIFTDPGSPLTDDNTVQIGHRKGYQYSDYDGLIDDVRLYDIALTSDEVWQVYQGAPNVSCSGFQPPMASGPVTARGNRALPLKAQLVDAEGLEVTDLELTAPPVLQVMFQSASGGDPQDVTDDALPAGHGTEGNEFEYNLADGVWQFNLKTKNYTADGTYTITMVSGDELEYIIDPTCEAVFEKDE